MQLRFMEAFFSDRQAVNKAKLGSDASVTYFDIVEASQKAHYNFSSAWHFPLRVYAALSQRDHLHAVAGKRFPEAPIYREVKFKVAPYHFGEHDFNTGFGGALRHGVCTYGPLHFVTGEVDYYPFSRREPECSDLFSIPIPNRWGQNIILRGKAPNRFDRLKAYPSDALRTSDRSKSSQASGDACTCKMLDPLIPHAPDHVVHPTTRRVYFTCPVTTNERGKHQGSEFFTNAQFEMLARGESPGRPQRLAKPRAFAAGAGNESYAATPA